MVSTILVQVLLLFLFSAPTQKTALGSSYVQTRSPHGTLNVACQNCHTSVGWKPIRAVPEFNHNQTKFPLRGMHVDVNCTLCHTKPVFANVGTKCAACHADIHKGKLGANCESCHTVRGWRVAVEQIKGHTMRFPLVGAHAAVDCDSCHKSGPLSNYNTMSTACYSCHAKDFQGTKSPSHIAAKFSTECTQCHGMDNWLFIQGSNFDHSIYGFVLNNAHSVPPRQCVDCHKNNSFNLTTTACVSCHLKDYQATTNPNHVSANFPQTCEQCHSTIAWKPASFDHTTTGFPLTNGHADPPRQCTDCHVNGNYNLTTTACVSCHLKNYQDTTNPNHVQANFPQTCQQCHSTISWSGATFDHSTTGFILNNAHAVPPRQCIDCHVNNNYNLTSTACASCHLKNYQGTTNPNHVTANFSQSCQQCHTTVAWQPASFDHSTTGFPLSNAHAVPPRQCVDCHVNGNYNLTTTACVSCHLKNFQSTTNPNHVTANFPQTCEQCHTTVAWQPANFDHSTTGFVLSNAHAVPPRQCTDCHVNNNYNLTSTACVTCHLKNYQDTTNPNHVQANFSQTCQQCHSTVSWSGATFDHSTTGFVLNNAHAVPPRQCTDCHVNNNYNLTSTACVSCHLKDYQTALTPVNHISANFPQTCEQCHDTVLWAHGKFDHTSTGFVLSNSHAVPPRLCTDCHTNNNYNLTSTACASCHLKDYQTALTPVNHVTAGFPQTCELCHDTTLWTNGKFDHNTTAFPLTGKHTVPPRLCADCHVNNNYTTLPTDCYGCHKADYQATANPGHAAQPQFFPTTCATCHTTASWLNATFNHTQYTPFPINHGNANGVCATCHINSNDYAVFQCTNCHSKSATDPHHQGVGGYVYNSINCYQCHRNGRVG